jgi:capsular exopolysaccharide synthesis family protein
MEPFQQQFSTTTTPAEQKKAKKGLGFFSFNVKRFIGTVIHYWYWFAISLILALVLAYIYLLLAQPLYLIKGSIVINQDKNTNSAILNKLDILKEEEPADFWNEINQMRSEDLILQIVDTLNLHVQYYSINQLNEKELYHDSPIRVVFDSSGFKGDYTTFTLKYTSDGRFNMTEGTKTRSVMYDTWISRPYGRFKIEYTYNLNPTEENFLLNDINVTIRNRSSAAQRILSELQINSADGRGSVLDLSYRDNIPGRGVDILNALLYLYMTTKLSSIDENAQKTRDFINQHKSELMADLRGIDSNVEAIKLQSNLVDPEGQATTIVTEKKMAQQNLEDLYARRKSLINLRNLLLNMDGYEIVVPLGVDDDLLEKLINDYNDLVRKLGTQERVQELGSQNPFLQQTLTELEQLKRRILEVLARISDQVNNSIEVTTRTETKNSNAARNIANADRQITEVKRGYDVLQNMYLFLFQKGIENEISIYNETNKAKVAIAPYASGMPISPIAKNIYMLAFFLGLLLPALLLLIMELLNRKVLHEDDIYGATDIPLVGIISKEVNEETPDVNIAVRPRTRSSIAEQFRILRANLEFVPFIDDKKVINVISSESNEGKTFVSLNLGIILALSTRRVVVVEFDLRRPRISDILNISNSHGVSEYLEGILEIQQVIKPSGIHSNLYVANCGRIPANPGDLMTYPSAGQMIQELQEMFDVVIVDTAPINLVTDAILLSKYAGLNLFVVRQGATYISDVKQFDELVNVENKIQNPAIVFNSVEFLLKYGYFSNPYRKYEQELLEDRKSRRLKLWPFKKRTRIEAI